MATLSTHRSNRAAAGAAYAAAAAAYVAAWVELKAYDQVVENANVGGGAQLGFGAQPDVSGHSEYLRDLRTVLADIPGKVNTRLQQLLAS